MWQLNEICVSSVIRSTRCKVMLTVWETRCARDKCLGRTGGICSRKRDRRLSGRALNNVTKGNGGGVGGVEAERNR